MKAYDLTRAMAGPAALSDIEFVALQMRADERAQWLATTGRDVYDPWLCARTLAMQEGPQFSLVDPAGNVLCVGGFVPQRPGVYQGWAAAVEGSWDGHWKDITAHTRAIMDDLFARGARRIETVALASRTAAHRWYRKGLRQQYEGTLRCYFADGQDAVMYACTNPES